MKISNIKIGLNKKTFIIAEIGVNHDGSVNKAKKLIYAAKKSGADAVKFQIINPDESYNKKTLSYNIFKPRTLSFKELLKLKKYAKKLKIIFFATPGDFSSLDVVKKLKCPAIKISSGLLTNIPIIKEAAKTKVPIIISTGFAEIKEIKEAVKTITKYHNKLAVLKCTSLYPAPSHTLNLNAIKKLQKEFKFVVGYSDHTLGELSCLIAVSLGAKIVEKHFTLNKKLPGADHRISMTPKEFLSMVKHIREIEIRLGKEKIFPSAKELKTRIFYRRTIVAKKFIQKGKTIHPEDLILQRNNLKGKRLHPREYFKIIGKKAKKNIFSNNLVKKDDLF